MQRAAWSKSAKIDVSLRHDEGVVTAAGLVSAMPGVTSARGTGGAEVGRAPVRVRLLSLLLRPRPPPLALGLVVGVSLIVAETLVLYPLKQLAPVNALGVVYLLGVMVVAIGWGCWLAAVTSVASALAFDYFHIPPAFGFTPSQAGDGVAVAVFVVVALLGGTLADMARSRATEAYQRRREAELAAELARLLLYAGDLAPRWIGPRSGWLRCWDWSLRSSSWRWFPRTSAAARSRCATVPHRSARCWSPPICPRRCSSVCDSGWCRLWN